MCTALITGMGSSSHFTNGAILNRQVLIFEEVEGHLIFFFFFFFRVKQGKENRLVW